MAFTDHAPRRDDRERGVNVRMSCAEAPEYLSSVAALKREYRGKIEILSGFEAEYVPGDGDFLRELKAETDIFVLGQHFVYTADGEWKRVAGADRLTDGEILTYAEYIERAVEAGLPDIIAHPDEFLHTRETFGEPERRVSRLICGTAKRHNIPLEINIHRVYNKVYRPGEPDADELESRLAEVKCPSRGFWEVAAEYGSSVVYGIDAHYRGEIAHKDRSAALARRIIGGDVLASLNFVEL